ncbi:MAG: molybdopterin molybdotransferase [Pseudomonadales bacterium]|jgi:molybdopterin molybdotransferase
MDAVDSCAIPGLTPVEAAIELLLSTVKPITETIEVPVQDALGYVLAQDQISAIDVPPADNSAMDGYAFCAEDLNGEFETTLPVSQRIPAGTAPKPLITGSAARIFTGAEIPSGADSVVMQESCSVVDGNVTLPAKCIAGGNVRPKGQDIGSGSCLLGKGHRLKPQDLGLLASVGIAKISVYRKVKIAVLSTGDELIEPGIALAGGQIYNSNRYTLAGLVKAMGWELIDLGIVADNSAACEEALIAASQQADCIITTGGVSVGEEDHVKACVEKLGSLDLWKLAIKPGKPFAFGDVNGVPFMGLPGNPAAVFVTFTIVARPYLLTLQGAVDVMPTLLKVTAGFSKLRAAKRQEYCRAKLSVTDGVAVAELTGNQSSGVLSTASLGNGFAVHGLGQTIAEGGAVDFIFFNDVVY